MDLFRGSKPSLPQVSVRMPEATKAAFTAYAVRLGIDISMVVNLLVLREKRLRRLVALRSKGRQPKRTRQLRGRATRQQHVTVYFGTIRKTGEFENYCKSCDIKRTDALAWLIEREVQEQWLERSLERR